MRASCALSTALIMILGGCAALPSSGPTGMQIVHAAKSATNPYPYGLVEITTAATLPPPPGLPPKSLISVPPRPTDLLGPGDVINITIYEAGVTLFGGSSATASLAAAATGQPPSSAERLPATRVDDDGYIRVPYVGRVRAAGRTASELAAVIQGGLRGLSQDAQVLVTVDQSITNSVIVAGEVSKPGRLVLNTNRESLVDAIALAGGYRGDAKDAVARVQRQGDVFEIRLSDLMDLPDEDVRIVPGDRITLVQRPQSFSALGASGRAAEITFPRARLSLAEAVALAGGANPNEGDAAGVFVFRYVVLPDGTERPTVYHLNMITPGAYLLSQRFIMQDRDVLYVANARSNQLTKFVQLLSQLFVPAATVRATVQ
ncbi:MAG: polysaccharide export protein [Sphingomonas sp.]|nr:polysaccharide export protein [Sphingomonas sp.]